MYQVNCQVGDKVLIVEYEISNSRLICLSDIELNGWKIDRRFKVYGGKWWGDQDAFIEFIITDKQNVSKIFKLYVNRSNKSIGLKPRGYKVEGWEWIIKEFIEHCTLWNCESWQEAMTPAYQISEKP
jgi:hypothetical protein